MQYTEKELKELIKAVETEFTSHLAKAEVSAQPAPLAKAEDESKEDKAPEKESEAPAKEESKEEKAPEAEGKEEAPAAEAKEGEAPAKEEAPAEAKEAAPAPAADEASGYDAEDIAQMDAMYMSMSKAELLAHHDSCVRALDAIGAEHTHAAPAAPAAEAAAPAAPAAEIDKCGDMSMQKSEANPELELAKSEAAANKAKVEELQKSLDTVSEFLTKLVKKVPQGKAITSMEQIAKSETAAGEEKQLSKSEITSILSKKAADPTLSKSDREAINAYYLNQSNINTISHLLK